MKNRIHFFLITLSYFIFFAVVFGESAGASDGLGQNENGERYHFLIGAGAEYRPERDSEKNYTRNYYSNYVVGAGIDRFMVILEKSEFSETSGNATLNLQRSFQDYLLWGQYSVATLGVFKSYAGLGVGTYKESVTTNFANQSSSSSSKNKLLTAGSLGLRVEAVVFFVDIEARLLFGDELDQQGTMSGVGRIGLRF